MKADVQLSVINICRSRRKCSYTRGNMRLSIDINLEDHKRLKATAKMLKIPIQEIVYDLIHNSLYINNIPNEETLKAMENVESGKNLTCCKDIEELFARLGD